MPLGVCPVALGFAETHTRSSSSFRLLNAQITGTSHYSWVSTSIFSLSYFMNVLLECMCMPVRVPV